MQKMGFKSTVEMVKYALKNNLNIKKDLIELEKDKLDLYTAWNSFIPKMTLSTSFSRLNKEFMQLTDEDLIPIENKSDSSYTKDNLYDYVMISDRYEWGTGIKFELLLSLNAALIFDIHKTVLNWKEGKITYELAEKTLAYNIKKNFLNLIYLNESLELSGTNLEIAKERFLRAETKYNSGKLPELVKIETEINYKDYQLIAAEIESAYNMSLSYFKKLLGINKDTEIELEYNKTDLDYTIQFDEKFLISFINDNLKIKLSSSQIQNLINSKNYYISLLTPSFIFSFTADPVYRRDPFNQNTSWFQNADQFWKQQNGMLSFILSLPLDSWFPFSPKQTDIIKSNYQIRQKKLELEALKNEILIDLKSQITKLTKILQMINISINNLELSKKAVDLTESDYNAGRRDYFEVENAVEQKNKSESKLLKYKFDYLITINEIEYIINNPIDSVKIKK